MGMVIIYQCDTCGNAWDKKTSFVEHGKKRGHVKSKVIRIPSKSWEELKEMYPKEDEI